MKVIAFHTITMRVFPKGRHAGWWKSRNYGMLALWALRLGEPHASGPARFCRPRGRDKVTCRVGWGKMNRWSQNKAPPSLTPQPLQFHK